VTFATNKTYDYQQEALVAEIGRMSDEEAREVICNQD